MASRQDETTLIDYGPARKRNGLQPVNGIALVIFRAEGDGELVQLGEVPQEQVRQVLAQLLAALGGPPKVTRPK